MSSRTVPGLTTNFARLVLALLFCFTHATATERFDASIAAPGTPIADVVDEFRKLGYKFAYSTSLLTNTVVVIEPPSASDPVKVVAEILLPYDIVLDQIDGIYVLHKTARLEPPQEATDERVVRENVAMSEIVVSASRYEILKNIMQPQMFVDQRQVEQLPIFGDDPARAAHILPGIAANNISARSYVRGSESRNTGIVLNGNPLLEPYHVRNFQSLFSTIDSRAVDGIEVYSGNFPVRYGKQTGGIMVIDTMDPQTNGHTELGLSVLNTSALSTGAVADGRLGWLVSARRGNLDLVIDEEYGEPRYSDVLGQIRVELSDSAAVSFNALIADDKIRLVTESKPEEPEASSNTARTAQFWVNWQQEWTPSVSSLTTVSANDLDSDRIEFVNDPEELVATISDSRSLRILRLMQHWSISLERINHHVSFGLEFENIDATYDYDGSAQYFGVFRLLEGIPEAINRTSNLDLAGRTFSAYLSDQFPIGDSTVAQLGIRWDTQDYGNLNNTSQFSPRISFAHALNKSTDLRLSVGRYYQAQGMHELQIEDGIERFFPAQVIDGATIGIQHQYPSGLSLRAEAYWKSSDRVTPRFENILNQITILPEFKPDRTLISPTGSRSRGIELSLQHASERGLAWWASYVYSTADDEIDGRFVPRSWDQKHALRMGLSVSGEKWHFGLIATGHSGWPKTSVELDASDTAAPAIAFTDRNQKRYPTFATLDMRVRYTRPARIGKLAYFLDVSNSTSRKNQCCVDFDLDTTDPNMPLLEIEQKYWLPLTPTLGVSWQF